MNNSIPYQKPHIILVDDEPGVLNALKLLLSAIGFSVSDFIDPRTALEHIARGGGGDVIVSDLRMPYLDGIQFLIALNESGCTIPFVLMSAHATSEDVTKAKSLGARECLAKPFTPEQFRTCITSVLG